MVINIAGLPEHPLPGDGEIIPEPARNGVRWRALNHYQS